MTLPKQAVSLSLAQGIDTKTDPKQVIQGKLVALSNGYFLTANEIRKRNGYQTLATCPSNSSVGCATYKNELVNFDGNTLWSLSTATTGSSTNGWVSKGPLTPATVTVSPVVRNTFQQTAADSAFHAGSGLQLFAWQDSSASNSIKGRIIDTATGVIVLDFSSATISGFSSVKMPKCAAVGSFLVLSYYNVSTTHLEYVAFSTTAPLASPIVVSLATDINTSVLAWDQSAVGTSIFVAYTNNASGITLKSLSSALALSSIVISGHTANPAISITGDGASNVCLTFVDNSAGTCFFTVYSSALSQLMAPQSTGQTTTGTRNVTANFNGSYPNYVINWGYEILVSSTVSNITTNHGTVAAGTLTPSADVALTHGCGLAGKALRVGTKVFYPIVYTSTAQPVTTPQPTYFLVASDLSIMAKIAPGLAGLLTVNCQLPEMNNLGGGVYEFAVLQKDSLTSENGSVFTQTGVMAANIATNVQVNSAETANNLHISGGQLHMYDGANVVEHGFHLYPEPVLAGSINTTGGNMANGASYQYCTVYEWIDNQGQLHRSAPSLPFTALTPGSAGSSTAEVTAIVLPTLKVTTKTGVSIALYRTVANQTVFYRISSPTSLLYSSPTVDTISYGTDTLADSAIIGNEQLYTTGGEVENGAPNAPLCMTTYQNRLIVIPSDNPLTWWFSKEVIPGYPAEFSPFFVNNVDQKGGNMTACAYMDSYLVMFKAGIVFCVTGEGPAPDGTNNDDFSSAQQIAATDGCINHNSVTLFDQGLIFQAKKGWVLLSRSLTTPYIGYEAEAYAGQTVSSAVVVPTLSQVRYGLNSGICLVYDYQFNQWGTFGNQSSVGACMFQGLYTYASFLGAFSQETPGVYVDPGTTFTPLSMTTGWLSFVGIQEYQRLYELQILGDYESPHSLVVQIAYDMNPTVVQTVTVPVTTTPSGAYQWRIFFKKQKCTSVQLTIADSQSSNFGEGCRLSALTFLVGKKAGINKLSAFKSYG